MDQLGVVMLIAVLCLALAMIGSWFYRKWYVRKTERWPSTEGIIESASVEVVGSIKGGPIRHLVPRFSYVVDGRPYSGGFTLLSYTDPDRQALASRLCGSKVPLRYNPERPQVWYIPEKSLEGREIRQKLAPHWWKMYPRD